jgi:NADH-quinone oxidoreductase subunit J
MYRFMWIAVLTALATALPALAQPQGTPAPAGTTGEAVLFYVLAAVSAGCALGCVIARHIVRMALFLLGTLAGVALLYFLMAANFLGVIQLIVYAGGTLIVIIFGVMLTSRIQGLQMRPKLIEAVAGALVCLGLLAGLVTILVREVWPPRSAGPQAYDVAQLGNELLSTYLVPFEVVSVLLLAVMIGAAYLAQPEPQRKTTRDER